MAQNSSVRKEIDHLVQERATFNDMIARLQKKIAGNKKVIADITEMAILAFDQRDEAQSKITALQVKSLNTRAMNCMHLCLCKTHSRDCPHAEIRHFYSEHTT